jgi:2,3-bisphosphoglycerate-dependent phosphoglycerate mutase
MAHLVLVRHGLTDWNKEGRWQGFTDIPLNDEGRIESQLAAEAIRDLHIDKAFTSTLSRTIQTYEEIASHLKLSCPVEHVAALNERDYGIYTGKNKWEVEQEIGKEQFELVRRGWDVHVPDGETLKMVYERVVPFYENTVLPDLKVGINIMLVSSGNTFRALIKYLEELTEEQVEDLELGFGEIVLYTIDTDGKIANKEVRVRDMYTGKH